MTQPIDNGPPTKREDEFWRKADAETSRSDDAMTWAAKIVCGCALCVLVLLLVSLLTACANVDRQLWDLLN